MQNASQAQTLDLFIPTASVTVQGTPNSQISYKVEKGKDSVVTYKSEKNKSELFVKSKANLKKPLEVLVPKKHTLHLEIGTGDVSLSSIETDLVGKVDRGDITVEDMAGSLYIFTQEGNVTIRNGEASGSVGSGDGTILIEDIRGPLQGYSQQGSVKHKFTEAYANKYNEKLELRLEKSELQIATILAKGADLYLEQGNVSIGSVSGPLQVYAGIGNMEITSLKSNLAAFVEQGDITVTVTQSPSKQELNLTAKGGNITLTLPSSFSGHISIEQLATDANKASYKFESEFNLGTIQKRAVVNEGGNILAYETIVKQTIGNGNASLTIRLTNGNLTLRKRSN